jgi:hypothetical protein
VGIGGKASSIEGIPWHRFMVSATSGKLQGVEAVRDRKIQVPEQDARNC